MSAPRGRYEGAQGAGLANNAQPLLVSTMVENVAALLLRLHDLNGHLDVKSHEAAAAMRAIKQDRITQADMADIAAAMYRVRGWAVDQFAEEKSHGNRGSHRGSEGPG